MLEENRDPSSLAVQLQVIVRSKTNNPWVRKNVPGKIRDDQCVSVRPVV